MTLDELKEFGADTEQGMARCLNKEDFYLKMVKTIPGTKDFDELEAAIGAGDLDKAFESAHALKGVLGNLALTPILTPVEEITEKLRAKEEADYAALVEVILKKREELSNICK